MHGILTYLDTDFTDESTGKQRQARIDAEDAEDILAEKRQRELHAKAIEQAQEELNKLTAQINSKGSKSWVEEMRAFWCTDFKSAFFQLNFSVDVGNRTQRTSKPRFFIDTGAAPRSQPWFKQLIPPHPTG